MPFGLDTSSYTGGMFAILNSLLFWLVLAIVFVVTVFGFLIIRKKRRLTTPVIELTSLGRGKLGIRTGKKLKGGWFKHNSSFFGLWDYGSEEVFKLKDGREVLDLSSEDYHEINGKMGVIVQRSPEDPRFVVPISKSKLENGELLNTIAPAEFRGTVVDIIKKAEKETQDKTDKVMQWVFWGGIILFSFVAIILITQMVKNGQAEAKELILEAGKMNKENLKVICEGYKSVGDTVINTGGAP